MPNRIIKESLCASEKIAQLSDFEFRLWIGLITQADDAGRGDARPAIIKGRVFPFRDRITLKDIDTAIHALAAHSCVCLYEVDGKPYYVFPSWGRHQRIRDVKPKYPPPNDAVFDSLPQPAANCGELRLESNPIQSNPNTESESESESDARARETQFDLFWKAYPKKVGKAAAKKAFQRVKAPLDTLLAAIERQKCGSQWTRENGRYIPNPTTWLNQGRWEDEEYGLANGGKKVYTERDLWDD